MPAITSTIPRNRMKPHPSVWRSVIDQPISAPPATMRNTPSTNTSASTVTPGHTRVMMPAISDRIPSASTQGQLRCTSTVLTSTSGSGGGVVLIVTPLRSRTALRNIAPGPVERRGTVRGGQEGPAMILDSKTMVVSGVGSGLGREIAVAAAREGANVALGARTEANLEKAAAEIDPSGARVTWEVTDITDPGQCERLAAAAIDRFGRIDALVNCAALDAVFGGL